MRVWMLIKDFYPFTGGAERQCLKLSKELITRGVNVRVITRRTNKTYKKSDVVESVPVTRLTLFRPFELATVRWLIYLIYHRSSYDVLHIHMVHEYTLAAIIAGYLFKKPVILKCASSGEYFDLKIYKETVRWPLNVWTIKSLKLVSKHICVSTAVYSDLLKWSIPDNKIAHIPNGVEMPELIGHKSKEEIRQSLEFPNGTFIILRVGSYLPAKGVPMLLQAWEKVVQATDNIVLVNVGGETIPHEVEVFAEKYKESLINVKNIADGVLEYYFASDALVLPSQTEGMSNVLLESQACGLPAIATNVGGNPDIIQNGKNGILVESGNSDQMATAIVNLKNDDELRGKMAGSALQISTRYSIKKIAAQYCDMYNSLYLGGMKKENT